MRDKEIILITGAGPNGVTGRRIKEYLQRYYSILSPSSKELNLIDAKSVDEYFMNHKVDYIVHSAVTAPSRGHDQSNEDSEVEDNLRMYFNLAKHSREIKKMFYLGSGAEFDKSQSINNFKEECFLNRIPRDKYGFVKYILNSHAQNSNNIYNLRVFGVINPYEPSTRNVISLSCEQLASGKNIELRRNCVFSFVDVDDISRFIKYGLNNTLDYHDYNMVGWSGDLLDVVDLISRYRENSSISFLSDGYNLEYTGNNDRLLSTGFKPTPIEESISKVINHFIENQGKDK